VFVRATAAGWGLAALVAWSCGGSTDNDTRNVTGDPGRQGEAGQAELDASAEADSSAQTSGGALGVGGAPASGGQGTGGHGLGGEPGSAGQSAVCSFSIGLGWDYRGEAATCDVPVDAAAPCLEAAECMCGEGTDPPPTEEQFASCLGSLFDVRGSVTLMDVCWSSPNEPQLSLGEALRSYAEAYGTTITTSRECESIPASF
jgi:hypothetical protein